MSSTGVYPRREEDPILLIPPRLDLLVILEMARKGRPGGIHHFLFNFKKKIVRVKESHSLPLGDDSKS